MSDSTPAMWMRGGTSKGLYFLKEDIPANKGDRDNFLLSIFGSPDRLQINGVGGGTPLTSKVAIVSRSKRLNVDVDYLFLQVSVDKSLVSDSQNCGNILAGVAPFSVERGLVIPKGNSAETLIKIYMENTGQVAVATVQTPNGKITYNGETFIDGVPTPHSPISLEFLNIAGSLCGSLLPTGNPLDNIEGIDVTMIDNGMPCIIIDAKDLDISGNESTHDLETNQELRHVVEKLRLQCGNLMNLGNVTEKTVPKVTIISQPKFGGVINTRTFIPHHCHPSIGVFGAISVATACLLKGSTAHPIASLPSGNTKICSIEHASGKIQVIAKTNKQEIISTAILRTARKLFDGFVFDKIN